MADLSIADTAPMPRRRRWLVYALAGGLIVGHAFDVVTKGEHWPVSSYPMYSELNPSTFKLVRLFGVTNERPPREIPIDPAWLRGSLMRIVRRPDASARLRQAVTQFAHSYGWRSWAPEGTEFIRFTVYEEEWTLRADADPDRRADRRKVLLRYERDGASAKTTAAGAGTTQATHPTAAPGEASRDAAR